jgi:hypothetical protein
LRHETLHRVRLRGVNSVTKRLADGTRRTYWYAWKGGPALPGKPGAPEFVAAYNAAIERKVAPPAGVLLGLLNRFQDSGEFQHSISERTRRDYVDQMRRLRQFISPFEEHRPRLRIVQGLERKIAESDLNWPITPTGHSLAFCHGR